jgi:hypothetical protein
MLFERLLAKSRPKDLPNGKPERESMKLHVQLADVHRAAAQLLDATGKKAKGIYWISYRISSMSVLCHLAFVP